MEKGSRTSRALSPGLCIILPSVTDVVFVALLCTLVFTSLSVRLLGDAGIGWHIRTGQIILATHRIPRVDPFSSTMAGKPWFAWEWLYDVTVGWIDSGTGVNGVVWFNALVIALVFACLFERLMRQDANLIVAVLLTLLAISASMIHFLARPHVVSWLLTLIWFAILDGTEQEAFSSGAAPNRRLWILPALMLVWVNLHGGFVIGFVLLGIYWISACWTWWRTKQGRLEDDLIRIAARRRVSKLLWLSVISAAASLVNPYGWKLHEHVIAYLSDGFLMNHIQEFQSPDFHGWAQRCFLVLLLIAAAALALRRRKLRLSGLLVVLLAIYSGLYAARNIPVASILLGMIVGPVICAGSNSRFFGQIGAMQDELRQHTWPLIAVLFTLAVATHAGRIGSAQPMDAHFDSRRMPIAAVNYIEQHNLQAPVLSTDFWGGYLVYRLFPREQVVVDDRHDLYGAAFFKSYLNMYRGQDGWQEFLRVHPAGCLLFPRDAAITNLLLEDASWKRVYEDQVAVIFVRASEQ